MRNYSGSSTVAAGVDDVTRNRLAMERAEQQIEYWQGVREALSGGKVIGSANGTQRRGRRPLTPAERKRQSDIMTKVWAERRRKKAAEAKKSAKRGTRNRRATDRKAHSASKQAATTAHPAQS